jgi:hypothetical protein
MAGTKSMHILIFKDDILVALMAADCFEAEGHGVMGPAKMATQAMMLCEKA